MVHTMWVGVHMKRQTMYLLTDRHMAIGLGSCVLPLGRPQTDVSLDQIKWDGPKVFLTSYCLSELLWTHTHTRTHFELCSFIANYVWYNCLFRVALQLLRLNFIVRSAPTHSVPIPYSPLYPPAPLWAKKSIKAIWVVTIICTICGNFYCGGLKWLSQSIEMCKENFSSTWKWNTTLFYNTL